MKLTWHAQVAGMQIVKGLKTYIDELQPMVLDNPATDLHLGSRDPHGHTVLELNSSEFFWLKTTLRQGLWWTGIVMTTCGLWLGTHVGVFHACMYMLLPAFPKKRRTMHMHDPSRGVWMWPRTELRNHEGGDPECPFPVGTRGSCSWWVWRTLAGYRYK